MRIGSCLVEGTDNCSGNAADHRADHRAATAAHHAEHTTHHTAVKESSNEAVPAAAGHIFQFIQVQFLYHILHCCFLSF